MTRTILLLILFTYSASVALSQDNDEIFVLKTFKYLDEEFHLHSEREGAVLMTYNEESYVYNINNIDSICRVNTFYKLEQRGKNKFYFDINSGYRGSFMYSIYFGDTSVTFNSLKYTLPAVE